MKDDIGAFIIRIGFGGTFYYRYNREPPKPHSNFLRPLHCCVCEGPRCSLGLKGFGFQASGLRDVAFRGLPIGPKVVPFWGSYFEFYKLLPKRNYFGAYGSGMRL